MNVVVKMVADGVDCPTQYSNCDDDQGAASPAPQSRAGSKKAEQGHNDAVEGGPAQDHDLLTKVAKQVGFVGIVYPYQTLLNREELRNPIVGFVTLMDAEVCIVFRSGYRVPGDRHPMETSRRLVGI